MILLQILKDHVKQRMESIVLIIVIMNLQKIVIQHVKSVLVILLNLVRAVIIMQPLTFLGSVLVLMDFIDNPIHQLFSQHVRSVIAHVLLVMDLLTLTVQHVKLMQLYKILVLVMILIISMSYYFNALNVMTLVLLAQH